MKGLLVIAAALLAGCPVHLQKNAPGNVDVLEPPANIAEQRVEPPEDPGERVVTFTYGGFGGVGGRFGEGDNHLAAEGGVEIGLQWGELDKSHEKNTFILLPPIVLAERRTVVNLGWALYEPSVDDAEDSELGPVYLEYGESEKVWGWAVGYSYDPDDDTHGPQVNVNGFGYYLKASYRFGRGADAVVGVVIKLPQSFVWSR